MSQGNHAYIDHVRRLEQRLGSGNEALRLAVGGESEAVGKLEYYLLRSLGLTRGPLVVDIGCGSGRLAQQLAPDKGIRYIGTDVVPRLIESAQALTMRDDWKFSVVDDDKGHISIPEEIRWENGTSMKSLGNLGQSVTVLRKV